MIVWYRVLTSLEHLSVNLDQTILILTPMKRKAFENIIIKGENPGYPHFFFLSYNSSCPVISIPAHLRHTQICENFYPLLNDKVLLFTKQQNILEWSKMKAFVHKKLKVAKMLISLFDKSRKHCGKWTKCWLPGFFPFPTVFSKAFFLRFIKSRNCVVKI